MFTFFAGFAVGYIACIAVASILSIYWKDESFYDYDIPDNHYYRKKSKLEPEEWMNYTE